MNHNEIEYEFEDDCWDRSTITLEFDLAESHRSRDVKPHDLTESDRPFQNRLAKAERATPVINTAFDLWHETFEPIQYVVPGFLAEGCTLLAGRLKLGKSWLVLDMGLAIALGGTCLGVQCEQGDVLYLALEDNKRRLKDRIGKVLGKSGEGWPTHFHFATQWSRANEGGLGSIRDWTEKVDKPRLVIIDVLTMFRPLGKGARENPYEIDYLAIKRLQELASEFSIAIVVVHHTRKGTGEGSDPIVKVSGTLGLSGAADTTLILDRDGVGTTLYGRGRDVEEVEKAVTFDPVSCRWQVLGEASEVRHSDKREAILQVLKEATEPMTPFNVAKANGGKRDNVKKLLPGMAKAGEVVSLGPRKGYVHPDRTDLLPPGYNGYHGSQPREDNLGESGQGDD